MEGRAAWDEDSQKSVVVCKGRPATAVVTPPHLERQNDGAGRKLLLPQLDQGVLHLAAALVEACCRGRGTGC